MTIRTDILLLVLGMAAVTYLPRALPAVLIEKLHFGPKLEKFLQAALICPGIFTVDASHPAVGLLGGAAAGVLAWRRCPVILCVLAAIAVDFALYLWL